MEIGSAIRYMPLLFKGSIKVVREDSDGNELLLYFLETGDTCAFSLSCCIGNKKSEIKAIIVEDAEMVLIPVKKWRNGFVNTKHGKTLSLKATTFA